MNLRCLFRALVLGAIVPVSLIVRADSFFRPPAGELGGRTRDEVVAVLGAPTSFAASNGREVLLYPLGRVDFDSGKVISADEGVRREFQRRTTPAPAVATRATTITSPPQPPQSPMKVQPTPTATAPDPAHPREVVLRSGMEPFFKTIGILVICVVGVGIARIVAIRRRRERSRSDRKLASDPNRPAVSTNPSTTSEDTRPWHDYDNDEPRKTDPGIITPLTSHDLLARRSLVESGWSLGLLRALEWKRFEDLTAAYFGEAGLIAKSTGLGADGGVDVELYLPNQTKPDAVVQCKAWAPSQPVGVKVIRELYGVMAADGIARGVFVTTSTFTDDAFAFARGKTLELIDGRTFFNRILSLSTEAQARLLARATQGDYSTPSCPTCGDKMVLRIAAKGRNTGDRFWGCPRFPRCRQRLPLREAGAASR